MNYTSFLIVLNLFLTLQAVVTVQQTNDGGETENLWEHAQRQSQGSNFASINETCAPSGESGLRCDTNKFMTCDSSDRICKCKMPSSENDPFYVYSEFGDRCYEVATKEKLWQCNVNEQCLKSTLGKFSKCHIDTKMCVCDDTEGKSRETFEYRGHCLVKKQLHSQCETDVECEESIKNTVCFGTKAAPNFGTCQCRFNYEFDKWIGECLQLGTINSTCKSDIQCNDLKALGELSYCSPNLKCECWDTKNDGNSQTGYYKESKKCIYVRGVNETCSFREECVLGYDKNAICENHPSYNNQKICQCPLGYTCSGSEVKYSFLLMVAGAFFIKSF